MGRVKIELSKAAAAKIKDTIKINLYIETHSQGIEMPEPQAELANFESVVLPTIMTFVDEQVSLLITTLEEKVKKEMLSGGPDKT